MSDDRSERRIYRRSPGRQYGYDYDPLRSMPPTGNGSTPSGRLSGTSSPRSEPLTGKDTGAIGSHETTGPLAPRPDPRRTRQLLRQQIIATKSKSGTSEDTGQIDPDIDTDMDFEDEEVTYGPPRDTTRSFSRRPLYPVQPRRSMPVEEDEVAQPRPFEDELDLLDPDMLYEEEADPLANRIGRPDSVRLPIIPRDNLPDTTRSGRRRDISTIDDPDYEDEELEERPKKKKGFLSRRKLIVGAVVVGGGAVAAYELGPKIPQALQSAGSDIEKKVAEAFQNGFAAGGEAVRKELINGLDTLEGVSLEGAIGAAKLTRTAYDVFVSPIVTLASTIADDFLLALLNALIKARQWLAQINGDNATLVALTNILQSWADQAKNMPKKLQTITQTDLDGAQTYLHGLQAKIQAEQAKLNGQVTPTPAPKPSTTPGSTTTPSH